MLEQARHEANELIEQARARSNRLLNEMEELKKQLNRQNSGEALQKARNLAKQSIRSMEKTVDATDRGEDAFSKDAPQRPLREGDRIQIRGFSREGTVERVSEDQKTVFVIIGSLRTKVPVGDVRLIAGKPAETKPRTRNVKGIQSKSERNAKRELDIRGFACDEGILELDRFLDEAVLGGVEVVTVIHGKGTGVLKKAVRAHLKNHPSVATFRPGVFGEGEDGVTVAELK